MKAVKTQAPSNYKFSGGGSLWIGGTLLLYIFATFATSYRLMFYNPIGLLLMLGYVALMFYFLRKKSINTWPAIKKLGWVLLLFIIVASHYEAKIKSGEVVIQQGFVYSEVILIACGSIATYLGIILLIVYLIRRKIDPCLSQPTIKSSTNNQSADIIPIEELEIKDPETKECPMCAETIKFAAKKC